MRTLRAWLVRVIGFVRPRHGEQEFADELQSHIDLYSAAIRRWWAAFSTAAAAPRRS